MENNSTEEISYQNLINLLDQGQLEDCVLGCVEHIERFGDSAKVWVLMGSAFGASNKPDKARQALLYALEIDPLHENAQVNYVTSCLHGGHKEDALKSLQEFLPGMSDECLAFKMAPCLAEALEQGMLESTDLNPRLWIRIENILDSVEHELDQVDELHQQPAMDNVIQFPLKSPGQSSVPMPVQYPLAHFIFEEADYACATLFVVNDHFHIRAYKEMLASPLNFNDPRGEACAVENPQQLADFLFSKKLPSSVSFLKLCRQDWESGEDAFFYFETFSQKHGEESVHFLVNDSRFEEENYHFRKDAKQDTSGEALSPFTAAQKGKGYRRLSDLWSPPYLGEIVFAELKKEMRARQQIKKAS